MARCLLLTQRFAGPLDAGGNRALRAFEGAFCASTQDVEVICISIGGRETESVEQLVVRGLWDMLRQIPALARSCSKYEVVAFDGLFPMLVLAYASLASRRLGHCVAVHHNNEAQLKRPWHKRVLYSAAQRLATRSASANIFFSERDLNALRSQHNSISCLPIRRIEKQCFEAPIPSDMRVPAAYIALPSNFSYPDNVDGLEIFYATHRSSMGGVKVVISTPPNQASLPDRLLSEIERFGDLVMTFPTFESYSAYLRLARAIVLPVFTGSGIQLKAIDALFSKRPVIASDFVRSAHEAFASFLPLTSVEEWSKLVADNTISWELRSDTSLTFLDDAVEKSIAAILLDIQVEQVLR